MTLHLYDGAHGHLAVCVVCADCAVVTHCASELDIFNNRGGKIYSVMIDSCIDRNDCVIKIFVYLISYRGIVMNHMIYFQYCAKENRLYIIL